MEVDGLPERLEQRRAEDAQAVDGERDVGTELVGQAPAEVRIVGVATGRVHDRDAFAPQRRREVAGALDGVTHTDAAVAGGDERLPRGAPSPGSSDREALGPADDHGGELDIGTLAGAAKRRGDDATGHLRVHVGEDDHAHGGE